MGRPASSRDVQNSYETVLSALLSALDTRDTEAEGHSERITGYTMVLASELGVTEEEMFHMERGALLHDIGKVAIPDRILHKAGPLTESEWEEIRKHPVIGHRMCSRIAFLEGASKIVLHHHERWDGKGYPHGLAGEEIPLGARVFAVVDAFDAMTTNRPYRAAAGYAAALDELRTHAGTQFDPTVVEAFLRVPEAEWTAVRSRVEQARTRTA
jgi:putative nucleotidyltransferase with HDIG domain